MPVSRRDALKTFATGLGAVGLWPYLSEDAVHAFAEIQATNAPPKLVFLTADQYAAVDAIAETIIPADEHSPGARAARVADYIDLLLAESDEQTQRGWRDGLRRLDDLAKQRFKATVAKLQPAQLLDVVTEIARNEANPRTPLDQFFRATKESTIRGYYTSEIGIQQELQYKGNQYLTEFVGCTHPEHGYRERDRD